MRCWPSSRPLRRRMRPSAHSARVDTATDPGAHHEWLARRQSPRRSQSPVACAKHKLRSLKGLAFCWQPLLEHASPPSNRHWPEPSAQPDAANAAPYAKLLQNAAPPRAVTSLREPRPPSPAASAHGFFIRHCYPNRLHLPTLIRCHSPDAYPLTLGPSLLIPVWIGSA